VPKITVSLGERNYLATIYRTLEKKEEPSTGYLAKKLGVRDASVVDMVRRLERKKLIKQYARGKITLTNKGVKVAQKIIHNHRILELFFHKKLNLSKREACIEAHRIDHQIGDKVITRICTMLKNPDKCIHGLEVIHIGCGRK